MLKRRWFGSIPSGVVIALTMSLLLVPTLLLAACASPTSALVPTITPTLAKTVTSAQTPTPTPTHISKPSGPIDAKWIEPQVNGDTVSVPVSEIENDWNTRFKLSTADGDIVTMAYMLNGVIYVRASICPPCRSQGFTLTGDVLSCDTCGTRFSANTGEGISGACVNYPKASVSYTISDGNVVMSQSDLVTAHQNTLKPGWP